MARLVERRSQEFSYAYHHTELRKISLHLHEWSRRCPFLGNVVMNNPIFTDSAVEEAHPSSVLVAQAPLCPCCQSERVETRSYDKKIGGALGAAAGIGSSIALILSGADIHAGCSSTDGPDGTEAGSPPTLDLFGREPLLDGGAPTGSRC